MAALVQVVLPVFLVIGLGYLAVWRGRISATGVDTLMQFTLRFALPFLLFRAIADLDLEEDFDVGVLVSYYTGSLASFLLGIVGAKWIFDRSWEDSVAIGFCCLYANSLLIGLLIAERAFGADALAGNYTIVAIHAPFCYLLGITSMEILLNKGQTGRETALHVGKAMFSNSLILGILLGFLVNVGGIPIPAVLSEAIDLMIQAALPVALFAMGGVLVRFKPEGDTRTIGFVLLVSLIVHPAIVWCVATLLELPIDGFRAAVLTASMAPGVNVYLFADMYGRARRVAASSVLAGTAISVFTIWVWLQILP